MKNLIGLIIGLIGGFVLGCFCAGRCGRYDARTISDTITYIDTIPYHHPVARDSTVIRYITATLPVYDTIVCHDTIRIDSTRVVVPITQKVYRDSTYRAYVSGYMPSLDSIFVTHPVTLVTRTVSSQPPRFSVSLQTGVGAMYNGSLHFGPYIGAGISIRLN